MSDLPRIIDANFNRAREALRVMEDAARFGLDHRDLCQRIKSLRHDLRDAVEALPIDRAMLLSARDVGGDVGASISTPGEADRRGLADVAGAAAGRLGEALRSIEEAAKALGGRGSPAPGSSGAGDGGEGVRFEAMRYRAYAIEKDLILAFGRGGRGNSGEDAGGCPQWRLCVLITEAACAHHPWLDVARQAIEGGADCLQLREKGLGDREVLARTRALIEIARPVGVGVVVNDRVDVALLAGADGVHLGPGDLPVGEVRAIVGNRLWIGATACTLDRAVEAVYAGADYCGLGPMFASTTKPKEALAGPDLIRAYLDHAATRRRPFLAISGITPERSGQLAGIGCRGVAVCSCICAAKRPAQVCRALRHGVGPRT